MHRLAHAADYTSKCGGLCGGNLAIFADLAAIDDGTLLQNWILISCLSIGK